LPLNELVYGILTSIGKFYGLKFQEHEQRYASTSSSAADRHPLRYDALSPRLSGLDPNDSQLIREGVRGRMPRARVLKRKRKASKYRRVLFPLERP
jgi:hypothetical protein